MLGCVVGARGTIIAVRETCISRAAAEAGRLGDVQDFGPWELRNDSKMKSFRPANLGRGHFRVTEALPVQGRKITAASMFP